jgi:choline-sulfatase
MAIEGKGNLLVILSDEHNPRALGCAGHPFVRTPNLDALAARGTRFAAAYTPSPICVPARAALATGQALHAMGRHYDNADPYDGAVRSWHHALREAGHEVVSIGKLHFRGLPGDDHGFSEERLAMHVVEGKGDLLALIRDETAPARKGAAKLAAGAGPGESDYTRYDRDICAAAQVWLRERAKAAPGQPWCLFVSLVTPHFPLTAPPEHYYLYPPEVVGLPKLYAKEQRPAHPFLTDYAATIPYDSHVPDTATAQRMLAGYYGLVSFMDEQVGKILAALEASGLGTSTRVLYASDHGDNAGARGPLGQEHDVRGERRRADDPGRLRRARRRGLPHPRQPDGRVRHRAGCRGLRGGAAGGLHQPVRHRAGRGGGAARAKRVPCQRLARGGLHAA